MKKWLLIMFLLPPCALHAEEFGDATVTHHGITLRTTARFAGAIDSLIWNGKEFIDRADHGRQLQSASNLGGTTKMYAETFNPTEAGSRFDGDGPTSTSKLLHLITGKDRLQTTSQMAFWLRPGEKSNGHPAKNTTLLSNHLLTKRVVIGWKDLKQILNYEVTFGLPIDEKNHLAQFELLTGYMPAEFSEFLVFNPFFSQLEPLSDGPGEQRLPVVLATKDKQFAMGIFSPNPEVTYGRFRFAPQRVVKWNAVHRVRNPNGVPKTDYTYRVFVPLGTREEVRNMLVQLHKAFSVERKTDEKSIR